MNQTHQNFFQNNNNNLYSSLNNNNNQNLTHYYNNPNFLPQQDIQQNRLSNCSLNSDTNTEASTSSSPISQQQQTPKTLRLNILNGGNTVSTRSKKSNYLLLALSLKTVKAYYN